MIDTNTSNSLPIGITPKEIWQEQVLKTRKHALLDAIQRYVDASHSDRIPKEWFNELKEYL